MNRPLASHSPSRAFTRATIIACALALPHTAAASMLQQAAPASATAAEDTAFALHVLNRITFGPRPGDVGRLLDTGIDRWIERQLSPDAALDPTALAALSGCELWTEPVSVAMGRVSGLEQFEMVDQNGATRLVGIAFGGVGVVSRDSARSIRGSPTLGLYLANGQLHACRLTRLETSEWQLLEVMTDFWENHFSIHGTKLPVRGTFIEYDRATIRPNALGKFRELLGAVARSPAMLAYLDNAVNSADSTRVSLIPYRKPAMPSSSSRIEFQRPGLNENYARELLELHTMGVDGGYTQVDVIEVARAFTGWSHTGALPGGNELAQVLAMTMIRRPPAGPSFPVFVFDSSRHDAEEKTVLGKKLAAQRGMQDGDDVLDIVARHPSTARFIARKLAVRFVSDAPPEALVERAAAAFTRTDGDIREVMRSILASPEFRSPQVYGAKVKSPLEFVLSLRRAMAAPVDAAAELVDLLVRLDQPPAGRFSPDGWPETGSAWMNVGAMSTRIGIATAVAHDSLPSIPVTAWPAWKELSGKPFDDQLDGVIKTLLNGRASESTRAALAGLRPAPGIGNIEDSRRLLRGLIALALSSPEFQRR